jgi:DNA repair exonuclease SbcCD ATPase subunit
MLISEIGIRGYKSYGNNEQVLKLKTDKLLLVGDNGAGKSSLLVHSITHFMVRPEVEKKKE